MTFAGVVRASGAVPLTVGATAWSSPVVASDGTVLALARDRAGVRLESLPRARDAAAVAIEPSAGRVFLALARGSNAAGPIVVRASEPGAVPAETESLVRLGATSADEVVLFRAQPGERLVDPVIAPGRQWLAAVERREPRERGERVTSRVLVISALDGSARVIENGDGDRLAPAFLGDGALGFVRREGAYSLFVRVPLGADGAASGPSSIAVRDRAAWSAVVPLDDRAERLVVARDAGHGPGLAIVAESGARVEPLTEEGRAALSPALTADARAVVFVGAGGGGMNLFRVELPGAAPSAPVEPAADREGGEREPRRFESLRANLANAPCFACHDHERGLDVVGGSAHANLACTDCHVDVTTTPHHGVATTERVVTDVDARGVPVKADGSIRPAPGAGLRGVGRPVASLTAASLACGSCHAREAERWRSDVHGKAFDARSAAAPGCPTCHGDHDVWKLADPRSRVARGAIADGCGTTCHEGAWDFTRVTGDVEMHLTQYRSDPVATYRDSIHAKKLRLGKRYAATCASCHTAHGVLPARDPASSLNEAHAAKTCAANGKCHVGAPDDYATLVDHVVAVPAGHSARGIADAMFGVIGAVTVAFAGGDLALDALRRALAWLRGRRKERRP